MSTLSLTLIQLVIFTLYVGFIVKRHNILPSISDSWYQLPVSQKVLFTLFTWGLGIPMLIYGNLWFFLSGAGLIFVGTATQFKMTISYTKQIHYAGALLGIFGALVGIGFMYSNFYYLLAFVVSALLLQISKIDNKLWWQEIVAFLVILTGLLVK